MLMTAPKQDLKIKLNNNAEFRKAWDAFMKLGYSSELEPYTAPYLYSYSDGRILADFFDVEGADLTSINSASGHFDASEHKEITLDELLSLVKAEGLEPFFDYIPLVQQERPLFEANYLKNGGDLEFLIWDECDNGAGDYQPNWEKIGLVDHENDYAEHEFGEKMMEHAKHVHSCLMSWVECAKSKAAPDGWILAPKEPNDKQKRTAMFITSTNGNAIDAYKAMLKDLDDTAQ